MSLKSWAQWLQNQGYPSVPYCLSVGAPRRHTYTLQLCVAGDRTQTGEDSSCLLLSFMRQHEPLLFKNPLNAFILDLWMPALDFLKYKPSSRERDDCV